jgi:hypothetical protein
MSIPRFEKLIGDIDGVNTTFTTSVPYQSGTIAVMLNGQLKDRTFDDGWIGTDPSSGIVDLKEAPIVGDTVWAFYLDTSPTLPEAEIIEVDVEVELVNDIEASIVLVEDISAEIGTVDIDSTVEVLRVTEVGVVIVEEISAEVEVCS